MENTFVWNSKVKFIRNEAGFNNLKECLEDEKYLYIGRKGIVFVKNEDGNKERFPKNDSIWCNPYKVGKDGDLGEVLFKYKKYIIDKIEKDNLNILELQDKTLMCWCVEEKKSYDSDCRNINKCLCHGQILLRLLKKEIFNN